MFENKQTFQKKDTTLIYTLNIYQLCKFGEHGKESFHIDFVIIKKTNKLKTKAQYIVELRMWLFNVCQGRILSTLDHGWCKLLRILLNRKDV